MPHKTISMSQLASAQAVMTSEESKPARLSADNLGKRNKSGNVGVLTAPKARNAHKLRKNWASVAPSTRDGTRNPIMARREDYIAKLIPQKKEPSSANDDGMGTPETSQPVGNHYRTVAAPSVKPGQKSVFMDGKWFIFSTSQSIEFSTESDTEGNSMGLSMQNTGLDDGTLRTEEFSSPITDMMEIENDSETQFSSHHELDDSYCDSHQSLPTSVFDISDEDGDQCVHYGPTKINNHLNGLDEGVEEKESAHDFELDSSRPTDTSLTTVIMTKGEEGFQAPKIPAFLLGLPEGVTHAAITPTTPQCYEAGGTPTSTKMVMLQGSNDVQGRIEKTIAEPKDSVEGHESPAPEPASAFSSITEASPTDTVIEPRNSLKVRDILSAYPTYAIAAEGFVAPTTPASLLALPDGSTGAPSQDYFQCEEAPDSIPLPQSPGLGGKPEIPSPYSPYAMAEEDFEALTTPAALLALRNGPEGMSKGSEDEDSSNKGTLDLSEVESNNNGHIDLADAPNTPLVYPTCAIAEEGFQAPTTPTFLLALPNGPEDISTGKEFSGFKHDAAQKPSDKVETKLDYRTYEIAEDKSKASTTSPTLLALPNGSEGTVKRNDGLETVNKQTSDILDKEETVTPLQSGNAPLVGINSWAHILSAPGDKKAYLSGDPEIPQESQNDATLDLFAEPRILLESNKNEHLESLDEATFPPESQADGSIDSPQKPEILLEFTKDKPLESVQGTKIPIEFQTKNEILDLLVEPDVQSKSAEDETQGPLESPKDELDQFESPKISTESHITGEGLDSLDEPAVQSEPAKDEPLESQANELLDLVHEPEIELESTKDELPSSLDGHNITIDSQTNGLMDLPHEPEVRLECTKDKHTENLENPDIPMESNKNKPEVSPGDTKGEQMEVLAGQEMPMSDSTDAVAEEGSPVPFQSPLPNGPAEKREQNEDGNPEVIEETDECAHIVPGAWPDLEIGSNDEADIEDGTLVAPIWGLLGFLLGLAVGTYWSS